MSTTDSPDDEPLFDPRLTNYEWPFAILSGVMTFVSGYVVMGIYILGFGGIQKGTSPQDILIEVGQTYYNAHNVVLNVQVNAEDIIVPGASKINRLVGPTSLPKPVYYAIPVVVLLIASGLLAKRTLDEDDPVTEIVLPATGITIGYTSIAAAGTFLIRETRFGGDVVLVPDITQAITFGLSYSLLCGLLGSLAIVGYRNREQIRRTID